MAENSIALAAFVFNQALVSVLKEKGLISDKELKEVFLRAIAATNHFPQDAAQEATDVLEQTLLATLPPSSSGTG